MLTFADDLLGNLGRGIVAVVGLGRVGGVAAVDFLLDDEIGPLLLRFLLRLLYQTYNIASTETKDIFLQKETGPHHWEPVPFSVDARIVLNRVKEFQLLFG